MAPLNRGRSGVSQLPPRKPLRSCCEKLYYTEKDFEQHLKDSPNHFPCEDCMAAYRTAGALKSHRVQMHATEQEIACPGCHRVFTRLGGLMGHMEINECTFIPTGFVEELRAMDPHNSGMFEFIRDAASKGHLMPATPQNGGSQSTNVARCSVSPEETIQEDLGEKDADLISFEYDEVSSMLIVDSFSYPGADHNNVLDFPVLKPAQKIEFNVQRDFTIAEVAPTNNKQASSVARFTPSSSEHQKPFMSVPSGLAESTGSLISSHLGGGHATLEDANITAGNAWKANTWTTTAAPASSFLFPNAPPAIEIPSALMESLSTPTSEVPSLNEHHPGNPNFKTARYYNQFAQAFHCPHGKEKSCKKPLKSATALIAHLRSAIHQDLEQQTCHMCHRHFPNATALTQHVESQAVRCGARKTDNIGTWVEDFTQIATKQGQHEDGTNKYVNRSDRIFKPAEAIANVVEANRRAAEAQASSGQTYWTKDRLEKYEW